MPTPPIPPSDQQSAPTRGDLLAAIALVSTQVQALTATVATLQAGVLNNQELLSAHSAALAALDGRLTGGEAEPEAHPLGWCGAILSAARTD